MTLKEARQCCKHDENFRINYSFFRPSLNDAWRFSWLLQRKPEMSTKWKTVDGNGGMHFDCGHFKEGVWPKERI